VLEWVPLADAVNLALSGEIVNATAAAGVLAAAAAAASDRPLRSTDAPWQDQPTAFAARK